MKKLRLNKLFHWLYAFLMFLPIVCFFGTILIATFNQSMSFSDLGLGPLSSTFISIFSPWFFDFPTDSVGSSISDVYYYIFDFILGGDSGDSASLVVGLLTYWTCVSLVYLVFDVVMYLINLVHRWIDEGGI